MKSISGIISWSLTVCVGYMQSTSSCVWVGEGIIREAIWSPGVTQSEASWLSLVSYFVPQGLSLSLTYSTRCWQTYFLTDWVWYGRYSDTRQLSEKINSTYMVLHFRVTWDIGVREVIEVTRFQLSWRRFDLWNKLCKSCERWLLGVVDLWKRKRIHDTEEKKTGSIFIVKNVNISR